jgi:glutamate 5-kinase
VLTDILGGEVVGTLFSAQGPSVASRKRWIGLTAQPNGKLSLDSGAQQAIEQQGRSLLAIGIRRVEGNFQKGDVVSLCRDDGQEFARGLTNYSSEELRRIAGQSTDKFVTILGHCPYDEVVHRDNLVNLG